ncbi:MAG TPA: 5'/3'-nucleotidase SurE [Vicinamibacterales bacterium]|nr:5'/3'-nucleotidase SurE [Vicinamibacterales bacterium]
MPRILVTNDDGHFSVGIHALADALRPLGDVVIVAPQTEASAVGHALTLRRPLRVEHVSDGVYAVDGTPTDCVNIAIDQILTHKPDLIVSGINKGFNIGDDVTYSGTVAGALEGALLGFQAIAVSQEYSPESSDYAAAAAFAARLAGTLLKHPLPMRTFLNVNVPLGSIAGVRTTVQARRNHITKVARREDPRGRPYFWIEEASDDWELDEASDHRAVSEGFISVTPLQPDLTDHDALALLQSLIDKNS